MALNPKHVLVGGVAALIMGAAVGAKADTLIDYTFGPGSVFALGGGNTYLVSGGFVYDASDSMISDVTYTATQIGNGPTGPFDFTAATVNSPTDVSFTDDGDGDVDEFFFAQSLALGGTDVITGGAYPTDPSPLDTATGAVTGVSAAPEPTTWSLMLVGVGGLGLCLRASRRKVTAIA